MKQERIYKILLGAHMSEKVAISSDLNNQYGFKVDKSANKFEVKKAVEALFSVNVEKVQILNVKGKVKMNRYGLSKRPSWKKAIVRLAQGQEIDFSQVSS
jgi:large subunit ribosomal protein L23